MSEQAKGVNVKTPQNFDEGVDHESSTKVWVTEGHLHVGRGENVNRETRAIYAPGHWISATVVK